MTHSLFFFACLIFFCCYWTLNISNNTKGNSGDQIFSPSSEFVFAIPWSVSGHVSWYAFTDLIVLALPQLELSSALWLSLLSLLGLTFGLKLPPTLASVTKTLFILPLSLSALLWLLTGLIVLLGVYHTLTFLSVLSTSKFIYSYFFNCLLSVAPWWWNWSTVITRAGFGVSQTWVCYLAWTFTNWGTLDKFIYSSIPQFFICPIRIIIVLSQGILWGWKLLSRAHDRVSAQKISLGVLPSLRTQPIPSKLVISLQTSPSVFCPLQPPSLLSLGVTSNLVLFPNDDDIPYGSSITRAFGCLGSCFLSSWSIIHLSLLTFLSKYPSPHLFFLPSLALP